ncbi:hypothetical protein BCR44DRAFT_1433264, partial [Catenaria anguillulae PL171]
VWIHHTHRFRRQSAIARRKQEQHQHHQGVSDRVRLWTDLELPWAMGPQNCVDRIELVLPCWS